jgi:DNA polymerase-3 subunit epsilon
MNTYTVIDFETTGLYAGIDRIIEVAAVRVCDGKIVGTFSELMNPGFQIPSFITSLTGITNAMVRDRPRPEEMMPRLRAFLTDHICIAHNASFDRRFLAAEMGFAGESHERRFLCSMLLSRRLVPEATSHKLGALAQHLRLETPAGMQAHRALADALLTVELWKRLMADLRPHLHGREPDPELVARISTKPKGSVASYLASLSAKPIPRAAPGPPKA